MDTNKNVKKGWSWLGFLFMPYYYSGYGVLKKGIVFAAILGLFAGIQGDTPIAMIIVSLLVGLSVSIYGGLNAKEELPIKEQKFQWANVAIAVFVYTIAMIVSTIFFISLSVSTPGCNDTETKQLVKKITLEEIAKLDMGKVGIKLSNIRTSQYDEQVEKYTCAADLTVTDKRDGQSHTAAITYTSQATDDGESFYVEVFGL